MAEERIDDGRTTALNHSVAYWQGQGDQVAVYDTVRPAGGRDPHPAGRPRPGHAPAAGFSPHSYWSEDRLVATTPIVPDSGSGAIGTVELARSSEPLDHRVLIMWALIGGVSAAGLVAAGIVAIGLARWVSRPITALAGAARDLGDGALNTRAQISSGPPEARRLAQAFNTMAARIESLVHGHQMLIADVSHQVRTPLAALRLRLDLLGQDTDEVTAAELAGAQEEIARLARLTNGLLAVARAENATAPPVRADIAAVVRDRVTVWRPTAEERGVTLTVSASGARRGAAGRRPSRADPGQSAGQRAGRAARGQDDHGHRRAGHPGGGPARPGAGAAGRGAAALGGTGRGAAAAAERRRAVARVTVSDNGPGMSAQQQRAAFRRFASGTARRHRAGARADRGPAGRRQRFGVAVGHPGRWPDRDDRVPARGLGRPVSAGQWANRRERQHRPRRPLRPVFPPRPADLNQF